MENLEFIDHLHFKQKYYRKYAQGKLSNYIDFCWQTNFDDLLENNPAGFSDVLFPNMGYTYLINLGSPFVMQLDEKRFDVKTGGFLPRHKYIVCHHRPGNQFFGIKFKICPLLFQKEVNFSEYREQVFPLAYLIERSLFEQVKKATTFEHRVQVVFNYYEGLTTHYESSLSYISIVADIIQQSTKSKYFNLSIETLAAEHSISTRTLQRYFEITTGFSSKPALQTIRMRQALSDLSNQPGQFSIASYNYNDYSHFIKHLKQFVRAKYLPVFTQFYRQRHQRA